MNCIGIERALVDSVALSVRGSCQVVLDNWPSLHERQNESLLMDVDRFMALTRQSLLQGAGRMSNQAMTAIAHERYESFDAERRRAEAVETDAVELRELERVEKRLVVQKKNKGVNDVA